MPSECVTRQHRETNASLFASNPERSGSAVKDNHSVQRVLALASTDIKFYMLTQEMPSQHQSYGGHQCDLLIVYRQHDTPYNSSSASGIQEQKKF